MSDWFSCGTVLYWIIISLTLCVVWLHELERHLMNQMYHYYNEENKTSVFCSFPSPASMHESGCRLWACPALVLSLFWLQVVSVVHNFKGKLLLSEESAADQPASAAVLSMGRMESPLEKYIASQVGAAPHSCTADAQPATAVEQPDSMRLPSDSLAGSHVFIPCAPCCLVT